ncbi:hypothetical protein BLNAU_7266 [Blattamonas nauphoetae]|uniref:Uncharacterized protein n=1 Tax=Blattamonas nauphoetae TaxID=2049346 RepID=A0ABQ9Y252_9EUKA|nr:hypothetical protein BLNAU_7266 [Blattamonas nauphoetae]
MENDTETSNTTNDSCFTQSPDSHSTVTVLPRSFLSFDPNAQLLFEDKSAVYCSLVALVKAEYPFDDGLQYKAARFLKNLEPGFSDHDYATKLVTDLVPSLTGSPASFIESISILLSSPHLAVVTAVLSFIDKTLKSSHALRNHLVMSDLVTTILRTVQPHTLQITRDKAILDNLIWTITQCLYLADPFSLSKLDITDAVEKYTHREMIFQKVVLPSSQFVTFLISNRFLLHGWLFITFMVLLRTHIRFCPFHRPTLEYVLASPIVMGFSGCHSFIEDNGCHCDTLTRIEYSLKEWNNEGPEVAQSGKRMMQALFSEGFEDTLEQMLKYQKSGKYAASLECPQLISVDSLRMLGMRRLLGQMNRFWDCLQSSRNGRLKTHRDYLVEMRSPSMPKGTPKTALRQSRSGELTTEGMGAEKLAGGKIVCDNCL